MDNHNCDNEVHKMKAEDSHYTIVIQFPKPNTVLHLV